MYTNNTFFFDFHKYFNGKYDNFLKCKVLYSQFLSLYNAVATLVLVKVVLENHSISIVGSNVVLVNFRLKKARNCTPCVLGFLLLKLKQDYLSLQS